MFVAHTRIRRPELSSGGNIFWECVHLREGISEKLSRGPSIKRNRLVAMNTDKVFQSLK